MRFLAFLPSDVMYAARRLMQAKVTSAAAILSLALAIGACTSAFRLIDALLLRPLPVASPERLYAVAFRGGPQRVFDSNSYPAFLQMKRAAQGRAQMVAVSYADRSDVTYASDDDMEKAATAFVSGEMFAMFGMSPALGRLLAASDDATQGASPVAVISHDYWTARFAGDPHAIGKTFRFGNDVYQIVGVAPAGFTGTETGTPVDIFLPITMKIASTLNSPDNFWLRILAQVEPRVSVSPLRDELASVYNAIETERSKSNTLTASQRRTLFTNTLLLEPAGSGRSNLQRDYRDSLYALAILVSCVLLIACANLANLMTARAIARAREMSVRVSLGAGRARLLQLVLMESVWIAGLATLAGMILSSWAAPFIVSMINSAETPFRLALGFDYRMLAFSAVLSLGLTLLFGLPSALRASDSKPAVALRGARHRRRVMHAMTMAQVAFCFVVLLVGGMFVRSFEGLAHQPLGYSAERIVNLESVARRPLPAAQWEQVADSLRGAAGVESVAISLWPFMSGESANSGIAIRGVTSDVFADRFMISPGWFDEMKIPMLSGRDFRHGESRLGQGGTAIVNQAFIKQYFPDEDALGKFFDVLDGRGGAVHTQVIAISADARYRDDLRNPIRPTFYIPYRALTANGDPQPLGRGTFVIRTAVGAAPESISSSLRKAVSRVQPGIRVSNVRAQQEIIESKTIRERLLALLAAFFAAVAMALAAVGLYGVLDYLVLQQRREIGIRIAIGAQNRDVVKQVTFTTLAMVGLGAILGLLAGIGSVRYIESILYHVRALDAASILTPALTILIASAVAAVTPVLRALRIDPVEILKAE